MGQLKQWEIEREEAQREVTVDLLKARLRNIQAEKEALMDELEETRRRLYDRDQELQEEIEKHFTALGWL